MNRIDRICPEDTCTGCGCCVQICPANCISIINNNHETGFAVYDPDQCLSCGKCKSACPQNVLCEGEYPRKCYAAWSSNKTIRETSASGGVATEIYRFFALNGWMFAGVALDSTSKATYHLYDSIDKITSFQNSKYVESFTETVYREIGEELNRSKKIVFVGLPCHVAGLKGYLRELHISMENLLLVDLVCHGTAPKTFLEQHIHSIEAKVKKHCTAISFRDPKFGTASYAYTLYAGNDIFYKKKVHRNDCYQIGYHCGLIYKDNCYQCPYATPQRQGDLTLSDFSGVGKEAPCSFSNINVSCVLINTKKGMDFWESIVTSGCIHSEERPIDEALKYEKQLISPTSIRPERLLFLSEYIRTHQFESSMRLAARRIILRNELYYYLKINELRKMISLLIPKKIKKIIKTRIICKR